MSIETQVVQAYFDAWNAHDASAILQTFSNTGIYSDPVGGEGLGGEVYANYCQSLFTAFSNQGLDGGFFASELTSSSAQGAALIVFYSENLQQTLTKIENSGGVITQDIFSFPGGRRFHFTEPSGNEFAVWSDIE